MNIRFSSRRLLAIGLGLVVLTNIFVLSGVVYNRAGIPESLVILTERELALPYYQNDENSGLKLSLRWQAWSDDDSAANYWNYYRQPDWLDASKLAELGFDTDYREQGESYSRYRAVVPKEVFIVLQFDGEQYQRAVKRAEQQVAELQIHADSQDETLRKSLNDAKSQLEQVSSIDSRLFAVDAGLDASQLRQQYPDRQHYIITRGLVKPNIHWTKDDKVIVKGNIKQLSIDGIHIPLEHRSVFDRIQRVNTHARRNQSPRYKVKVAYGQRFEPWVTAVDAL